MVVSFNRGLFLMKEPGKVEADFARIGTLETLRLFMTHPLNLQGGDSINDIFKEGDGKLPPYFTEEDLKYYTEQFERSGFTGPVNYYRAMDKFLSHPFALFGSRESNHKVNFVS